MSPGKLDIVPDTQSFGDILTNHISYRDFTFRNIGDDVIQVLEIRGSPHFWPSSFSPFSLTTNGPGREKKVTVEFFPHEDVGTFNETLIVTSNPQNGDNRINVRGTAHKPKGNLDIIPDSYSFSEIVSNQTASADFIFKNKGDGALQVTAISSSTHFSPVAFIPFLLAPNDQLTVTIEFIPNGDVGTFNETINVARTESGDNHIDLSGISYNPSGELDIIPDSQSFGTIVSNGRSSHNFIFKNVGGSLIRVTSISGTAHFKPLNFTPFSLLHNISKTVTIEFIPNGAVGTFNETINVANAPQNGDNRISVSGTSYAPRALIFVYPSDYHNYGKVAKSCYSDFSFRIVNGGELPLVINSVDGPNKPEFTIISIPSSIPPGDTKDLQVRFAPSSDDEYSDSILIHSNAENSPERTITLQGQGYLTWEQRLLQMKVWVTAKFAYIAKLPRRR